MTSEGVVDAWSVMPMQASTALLDRWADGTFVLDADFTIVRADDKAARLFRGSQSELVGRSFVELAVDCELARRQLAVGGTRDVTRMTALDGAGLLLELAVWSGCDHGRIICIAHDATALLAVEERLARSEASFRALIERSPDAIAVHHQGTIVHANTALATMLRWDSPAAFVGSTVIEVVHADDRSLAHERILGLASTEAAVPFDELRLLRSDGTVVPVWIGAVNVVFDGIPCVAVIGRDMTEQRRLHAQLVVADRMVSLGTLAAGVAHEINNPLTYVMLGLDVSAARVRRIRDAITAGGPRDGLTKNCSELETALATTVEGVRRVSRIVADLRRFGRVEEDEQGPVSIERALDLTIGMAIHEIRHVARLEREPNPAIPIVHGNEGRLVQVFLNLVINALQSLVRDPQQSRIRIQSRIDATSVCVTISDNGRGIAAEHLPRLFDPFFTTKPVGTGTGLGLSVCHGIVTALGGTISVESQLGIGSTFAVTLPILRRAVVTERRASVATPRGAKRLRILVVDDEESIRRSVAGVLAEVAEIVAASSVSEAREVIVADPSFDILLCDLRMPQTGGLALRAWLRARHPALVERVLFMSGGRLDDAERVELESQRDQVLAKPFDVDELLRKIDATLRARIAS